MFTHMTLVLAANLSDRLYLAADTRVTRPFNGAIEVVNDDQLKVAALALDLLVGCSGNAGMAAYVVERLKRESIASQGVRLFRAGVDSAIRPIVGDFLTETKINLSSANLAMIFVGQDKNGKKKLSVSRLTDILKSSQKVYQKRIDSIGGGKNIRDFSKEEHVELFRLANESKANAKESIFQGLVSRRAGDSFEVSELDSHLFKVEICCSKTDEEKFIYTDYDWGGCAVIGSGYKDFDIPEELFFNIELSALSGHFEQDGIQLVTRITEKFSPTIGGCVTTFMVKGGQYHTIAGQILRVSAATGRPTPVFETTVDGMGQIYRKDLASGVLIPLTPLEKIKDGKACLL